MNKEVMFSSKSDMWTTPQDLFDKLDAKFNFKTDVCAIEQNANCANYYSSEHDGLQQEWNGTCWMNPPYGREIGKWWHDYSTKEEITDLKGRLKFGNSKNAAPLPSAVVVFRSTVENALKLGG